MLSNYKSIRKSNCDLMNISFWTAWQQWLSAMISFVFIEHHRECAYSSRFVLCYDLLLVDSWWRHQMETFSALLAICAGNSPVTGEFPAQRPVTRSFDVFFDLRLNKRLSKLSWGWWFETLSRLLWRHRNVYPSWRRHQMETFLRYWPFVRGIHRSQMPMTRSFMFSLISAWTNGWANNRDVCDLRRHRAHYDATILIPFRITSLAI